MKRKHRQKEEALRITEAVKRFERERNERCMENVRVIPFTKAQLRARAERLEKLRRSTRTKREWENDVTATRRTTSV